MFLNLGKDSLIKFKVELVTKDFKEEIQPIEISEYASVCGIIDKFYDVSNIAFQLRPEADAIVFSYDGMIYTITPDLMEFNDAEAEKSDTYKENYPD